MKIVALQPSHLLDIDLQAAQASGFSGRLAMTTQQAADIVAASGVSAAAVDGDQVIACAGIVDLHGGRGHAWAMFSARALAQFKTIHRVVLAVLAAAPWRRIEMAVDCEHASACRWAQRLGFACEGRMRAYTPDGRDSFLYARIKG